MMRDARPAVRARMPVPFNMRPSQVAQVPPPQNLINLGLGMPEMGLLPNAEMKQATLDYMANPHPHYLAYGYEPGPDNLRCVLADFLTAATGDPTQPEDLFISGGASQGLDMICSLYTRPGDTIFIEEPTYFLALRIFEDHRLNVVPISMTSKGISLDHLQAALSIHRPRFLYTIPTNHNPTGITQSADVRQTLVDLSVEHDFLIVADEVYHLLNYFPETSGRAPLPLAALAGRETVISVNSFSKILAPGLRLGWIKTAAVHRDRFCRSALLDSGGGVNPFTSQPVYMLIKNGGLNRYIDKLKAVYRSRIETLDTALRASRLNDLLQYQPPAGGYFFWLELPEKFDTADLLPIAREHGVGFKPGANFSHGRGLRNYLRLSFAFYDVPDLIEGVDRLTAAVQTYLK